MPEAPTKLDFLIFAICSSVSKRVMIFKLGATAEKTMAEPRWPQPVAQNHPRCKFADVSKSSDLKPLPPDPSHHQDSAIARYLEPELA
jgi:hypothetical protein